MKRHKKAKKKRLEDIEKRREKVVNEYKYIADSARSNRGINITRNIGTLTMIFGAAAGIGLLAFREPTLATTFGAVAMIGIAIYNNRKLHRNVTLKLAQQKEMSAIADRRRIALVDTKRSDLTEEELKMPSYEDIQNQARKIIDNKKGELLNKTNYKIIQNALIGFAAAAGLSSFFNVTEKLGITNIEDKVVDFLDRRGAMDEDQVLDVAPSEEQQRNNQLPNQQLHLPR